MTDAYAVPTVSRTADTAWERIAHRIETDASGPSASQLQLGATLGVVLPSTASVRVSAVILRAHIAPAILESVSLDADDLETLNDLEERLGLDPTSELLTGSRGELRARIGDLYDLMTAKGLRELQPEIGDIVEGGPEYERWQREISSIAHSGRVHMRGAPPRMSWPNHLRKVAAVGSESHTGHQQRVRNALLNDPARSRSSFSGFDDLTQYEVSGDGPSPEAVRELEELLATESQERPFQVLIERHPELLATTVIGNWRTFVIPQARLGSQYVTDFLVLGISSAGPQWVTVEIEAPRHALLTAAGSLTTPVRHAVSQIDEWREWLTTQVAYAQAPIRSGHGLGLKGITNQAPGLVIIGRADPSQERDPARSIRAERDRIEIHSWDWLLRHASNMVGNGGRFSDFARASVLEADGAEMGELTDELFG